MPTPLPPKPGGLYKAAIARLSPEMREVFDDVCLTAKLTEDDPVYGLVLCQAMTLDAFKASVTRDVTAAIQSQLHNVIQRLDQIQRDRATTDATQTQLFYDRLGEISRRETAVTARESQSWKDALLTHGITAAAVVMLFVVVGGKAADRRVEEERDRGEAKFQALVDKLPYATKLETQLEAIGANLDYRHVDGSGKTRGHYELALKPGPGFKPIGAGVDRSTGEAVILFPE